MKYKVDVCYRRRRYDGTGRNAWTIWTMSESERVGTIALGDYMLVMNLIHLGKSGDLLRHLRYMACGNVGRQTKVADIS